MMIAGRTQFGTLAVLWTALALAYGIAVNRIDDSTTQLLLSLLYAVAVVAVARLVNARRPGSPPDRS